MMSTASMESLLAALQPLLRQYLPERLDTLARLSTTLHDQRVRLLVFGAYNAGKSTLVNALLGHAVAPVGDEPTTCRTNEYDWGTRILLDAPGVNAPGDHEAVAADTLRAAQRILFVVREGDQDCADVYDRLFELLSAQRRVILLVNHQYTKIEDAEALRQRLLDLLLRQATQRGVPDTHLDALPVLLLNAQLALRGRLESEACFVRESGFEDVSMRLEHWLHACEQERSSLEQLQADVTRELLQPLLVALDTDDASQAALAREAADLGQLQQRLRGVAARTHARLANMYTLLQPKIGAVLDQSQGHVEVLKAGLVDLSASVAEDLASWLEEELAPLFADADSLLEHCRATRATAEPSEGEQEAWSTRFVEAVGKLAITSIRGIRKDHLLDLLKAGRAAKIGILKGRWERTLEKWAGKAMPWIQAGIATLEIGLAEYEQHQQNAERRRTALQRQQWIDEIASGFIERLQSAAKQALAEVETQLLGPLRQAYEVQRRAVDEQQQTALQVREWLAMLAFSQDAPSH